MDSIGKRILFIRNNAKLNQREFAKRIGISGGSVSMLETGTNNPSEQTIKLICREFNVSYFWLTEGIEPVYTPEDISVLNQLTNIMNSDNEFAKRVFTEFAKMPREAWLALETVIDNLAKK
ncbi:MAG TPA: helix-turn-helix transcriptional regulator [Candidatus Limiplasma sp.]|nr:helix-turn-helix transcriptional regulator [Candidatus Limiplasma sp.]HRX09918.1 helix-turn-helix transcriptional regulator [Candidatus Limiplasma sp.]